MTQCGQCGQINECSTGAAWRCLVLDWGNICWGFSNKFDILHIFPALGLSSPGPGPAKASGRSLRKWIHSSQYLAPVSAALFRGEILVRPKQDNCYVIRKDLKKILRTDTELECVDK